MTQRSKFAVRFSYVLFGKYKLELCRNLVLLHIRLSKMISTTTSKMANRHRTESGSWLDLTLYIPWENKYPFLCSHVLLMKRFLCEQSLNG